MKKLITLVVCLALALTTAAALAESGTDPLHDHLAKLADTPYTISTTEYGPLEPGDFPSDIFVELLNNMKFEKAEGVEAPDGEYVVLAFPQEGIRFDFFLAQPEMNLFRLVNADGSEELYKAIVPEEQADISGLMSAWYASLAEAQGLVPEIQAKMPEEGWILDSVNGQAWMDDRASLEVFLEDTENYKVLISWGSSASEHTEWVYGCSYQADNQTLKAEHMIKENVVTDDQGNETRTTEAEKDVDTVFALNADGKVVITGAGDEQLEGKTFEPVPADNRGQWTIPESNEMTEELTASFRKGMEKLVGVDYTPVSYLGEKDGIRCFLCRAVVVYPGAEARYTLVYLNDNGVEHIADLPLEF